MFTRIIIGKVRKELNNMNFIYGYEILPMKIENDIWSLKIFKLNKSFIVKYFDKVDAENYVHKYLMMEKYGILMPKIIKYSNKLIIFEDYSDNSAFEKVDLANASIDQIVSVARWYKKLHSLKIDGFRDYRDYFTLENIYKVMNRYNLKSNVALELVCSNFSNINLKLRRLDGCLVLNDFSLDNLVISRESDKVMVSKFDDVIYGCSCIDIHGIKEILDDEKYALFMSEYGIVKEDEEVVGDVVFKIINLYLSIDEENVSSKNMKILDEFVTQNFKNKIESIIEWY